MRIPKYVTGDTAEPDVYHDPITAILLIAATIGAVSNIADYAQSLEDTEHNLAEAGEDLRDTLEDLELDKDELIDIAETQEEMIEQQRLQATGSSFYKESQYQTQAGRKASDLAAQQASQVGGATAAMAGSGVRNAGSAQNQVANIGRFYDININRVEEDLRFQESAGAFQRKGIYDQANLQHEMLQKQLDYGLASIDLAITHATEAYDRYEEWTYEQYLSPETRFWGYLGAGLFGAAEGAAPFINLALAGYTAPEIDTQVFNDLGNTTEVWGF